MLDGRLQHLCRLRADGAPEGNQHSYDCIQVLGCECSKFLGTRQSEYSHGLVYMLCWEGGRLMAEHRTLLKKANYPSVMSKFARFSDKWILLGIECLNLLNAC